MDREGGHVMSRETFPDYLSVFKDDETVMLFLKLYKSNTQCGEVRYLNLYKV